MVLLLVVAAGDAEARGGATPPVGSAVARIVRAPRVSPPLLGANQKVSLSGREATRESRILSSSARAEALTTYGGSPVFAEITALPSNETGVAAVAVTYHHY